MRARDIFETGDLYYHATDIENLPSIHQHGMQHNVGDLTKRYHKDATAPLIYATDASGVNTLLNAMTFHIRKRIGFPRDQKWRDNVMAEHGALVVLRVHIKHCPWHSDPSDHPVGTEWGDYYTDQPVEVVDVLTGEEMLNFLYAAKRDDGRMALSSTPEFSPTPRDS